MKPNIDKFNKIYLKAFGYNPCPMGEPELEKFYDLVVMQCMEAALDPMNYDSTECGEDVAADIAMVIEQSLMETSKLTKLIAYHHNTSELALFTSEGTYWVGTYFPHRTDCNPDNPYPFVMYKGYFDTKEEGLAFLASLTGDEF